MKKFPEAYCLSGLRWSMLVVFVLIFAGCAPMQTTPSIAVPGAVTPPALSSSIDVKIIAFNDFHGNLKAPSLRAPVADASQPNGIRLANGGGVDAFAAVVKSLKEKNKNHAVVTAGDMVGATPLLSALFKDEPTIEAMNLIGLDFHAVGNHEFDYGPAHLKRLATGGCAKDGKTGQPDCQGRPPFKGANFTFLAANVIDNNTDKTLFAPYGIKEFDGVKVAFIGMTLAGTPSIVRPGGAVGLTFKDELETVRKLVPELKQQGVEAMVVVLHEGGVQTGNMNECVNFEGKIRDITEKLPKEIDIVISAHSHRFYICNVDGRLVTSAGSAGIAVTEIDLKLDRATRDIVSTSARNLLVDPNGSKEVALTELVERYSKLAEPLENRVIAKVTQELSMIGNPAGESALGNLVADAQLYATAQPDKGGAVIAFNNAGSLRSPIIPDAQSAVTYGGLFRVQPFQNDLVVMNLTGKQIKIALEQQFGDNGRSRLMGVSKGLSYTWDASKPSGQRILAESIRLNGTSVRGELQYRVTANSFIAGGSEGMTIFREGTDRMVSMLDVEALVEYLAANSPYKAPPLGTRIMRLN
jgi:5'-nucleotidase